MKQQMLLVQISWVIKLVMENASVSNFGTSAGLLQLVHLNQISLV
jgi:hypothetical protein